MKELAPAYVLLAIAMVALPLFSLLLDLLYKELKSKSKKSAQSRQKFYSKKTAYSNCRFSNVCEFDSTGDDDLRTHEFRRRDFLSAAEDQFLRALWASLGNRYYVVMKVGLWSVVKNVEQGDWNKISQKHLDFLLCEPTSMTPVLAIELDDPSHDSVSAQARDEQKNIILEKVGLPLLRIRTARQYNPLELAGLISQKLAPLAPPQAHLGTPIIPVPPRRR